MNEQTQDIKKADDCNGINGLIYYDNWEVYNYGIRTHDTSDI